MKIVLSSLLNLLLLLLLAAETEAAPRSQGNTKQKNPIVIVPGFAGSQLTAKLNKSISEHLGCNLQSDWNGLWANIKQLIFAIHCFVDNAKLSYDPVTRKTRNTEGVDIKAPGFGETDTIEWLDTIHIPETEYMSSLVEFLVNEHNYVRGVSVRGAPYDFRHSPNEMPEYFVALKRLIEETFAMNFNRRVILMAHSMGNNYIIFFLNRQSQAWKDKYIKSFVAIAGPYGGSVRTLRLLASGDNLDVEAIETLVFREVQRTLPSLMFLMPYDNYWNGKEILVYGPQRNYTVNDYKQFFTDIEHPTGYFMRQDTENLMKNLKAPGVEVHCLYGSNVSTISSMSYVGYNTLFTNRSKTVKSTKPKPKAIRKPTNRTTLYASIALYADPKQYRDLDYKPSKWYDQQPRPIYGDGDGTVNIRSLEGCRGWAGKQKQPVSYRQFPGENHMSVLSSKGLKTYLTSILK